MKFTTALIALWVSISRLALAVPIMPGAPTPTMPFNDSHGLDIILPHNGPIPHSFPNLVYPIGQPIGIDPNEPLIIRNRARSISPSTSHDPVTPSEFKVLVQVFSKALLSMSKIPSDVLAQDMDLADLSFKSLTDDWTFDGFGKAAKAFKENPDQHTKVTVLQNLRTEVETLKDLLVPTKRDIVITVDDAIHNEQDIKSLYNQTDLLMNSIAAALHLSNQHKRNFAVTPVVEEIATKVMLIYEKLEKIEQMTADVQGQSEDDVKETNKEISTLNDQAQEMIRQVYETLSQLDLEARQKIKVEVDAMKNGEVEMDGEEMLEDSS